MNGPTVAEILDRNRGKGPGFDFLRIALALCVVLAHSVNINFGRDGSGFLGEFPIGPFYLSILPMFFGLSGFLVTASALRLRNTRTFLIFRALRIVPALLVEVTLAALVLGPILTTRALHDYFTDRQFFAYFGNIVGRVRFHLPGVFENGPLEGMVNGNLWTLRPEFGCYLLMAILMLTSIAYKRRLIGVLWLAATAFTIASSIATGDFRLPADSNTLIYYFITGVVAFCFRDYIRINTANLLLAVTFAYACLLYRPTSSLAAVPLTYILIWIGMRDITFFGLTERGDYSYGIYLYSFPIQQTLWHLVPISHHWYMMFVLASLFSIMFAAFSWHYVEQPFLGLKKFLLAARPAHQPQSQSAS